MAKKFLNHFMDNLFQTIKKRQRKLPSSSYTASLFKKGPNEIIKKIGEEAIEVIIAAQNKDRRAVVYEVSDLYYHLLVLLAYFKLTPTDIYQELKKRRKINQPYVKK